MYNRVLRIAKAATGKSTTLQAQTHNLRSDYSKSAEIVRQLIERWSNS